MLSKAERWPDRIDLPLRRIRATVPAHSNPPGLTTLRGLCDSLIETIPSTLGTASLAGRLPYQSVVPSRSPIRRSPAAFLTTTLRDPRRTTARGTQASPTTPAPSVATPVAYARQAGFPPSRVEGVRALSS